MATPGDEALMDLALSVESMWLFLNAVVVLWMQVRAAPRAALRPASTPFAAGSPLAHTQCEHRTSLHVSRVPAL